MSKVSMLERFQEEVVKQGRDTTLPSKLNDFWLDELQKNFEKLFESIGNDSGSDSNGCMSLALAAIIHILLPRMATWSWRYRWRICSGILKTTELSWHWRHFEEEQVCRLSQPPLNLFSLTERFVSVANVDGLGAQHAKNATLAIRVFGSFTVKYPALSAASI